MLLHTTPYYTGARQGLQTREDEEEEGVIQRREHIT